MDPLFSSVDALGTTWEDIVRKRIAPAGANTHNLSASGQNSRDGITIETPHAELKHLARTIRKPTTPFNRKQEAQSASTVKKHIVRTPSLRPPQSARVAQYAQPLSARKNAPSTPHTLRALERQRTVRGTTPGRGRRRSIREQRETPFGILRNLSRVLAKQKQSSNSDKQIDQDGSDKENAPANVQDDGDDDDTELSQPRLSMPLDVDDSDDFDIPPRMSIPLNNEELTQASIEFPRRAYGSPANDRLSRFSIANSDRIDDLEDLDKNPTIENDLTRYSIFAPSLPDLEAHDYDGGDTEDLRRMIFDTNGRTSFPTQGGSMLEPQDHRDSFFAFDVRISDPLRSLPQSVLPTHETSNTRQSSPDIEIPQDGQVEVASMGGEPGFAPRKHILRSSKNKVLQNGNICPVLPAGTVKKLAQSAGRSVAGSRLKLSKDALAAIMQASDWFFEQLGDDLVAYSEHAGRKTIDESDVIALMRRQRQLTSKSTAFSLAQKHLPRELLQSIRMPPPKFCKTDRKGGLDTIEEEEYDVYD